nr:putative methyltransferase [uncultured bacterium]
MANRLEDHEHHAHEHHGQKHHGQEHHGHENDQGIKGALRYLRWLPQMWRSPINDAIIDLIDPQPGERAIDVGAGMGAGAMRAAACGAHVLAVEPTPFIRRVLGVRRTLSRHRRNVEVVNGAAEQLPVADRSVDVIWAVNTMHHWVDVDRGVAEIARVLRPAGRILLVDEVFTDPAHPEYERFGSEHGPEHHGFTMVDAEQMGARFRAAGLGAIETSDEPIAGRPALRISATGRPDGDG